MKQVLEKLAESIVLSNEKNITATADDQKIEKMLKNNFMILVSRNSFHFHKMPVENQHITVSTWEEKNEPLQFIRAYEIKDTRTEEKLVSGLSSWLLVSAKERKLLPAKLFNLRQPVEYESESGLCHPSDPRGQGEERRRRSVHPHLPDLYLYL